MAYEFTPDDAVQAIHALTRMLEAILARLTDMSAQMTAMAQRSDAWTRRAERWMRWHFWLLALVLLSSAGMFVIGVRTHATHNDALRQVMEENRAIFERLTR
jgi:hypothetical protein